MNKVLSVILSFLMICSCMPVGASDIDNSAVEEAILNVKSAGLMKGYEDGELQGSL